MTRPVKPTFLRCACGATFRANGLKIRCGPCAAEAYESERAARRLRTAAERRNARTGTTSPQTTIG